MLCSLLRLAFCWPADFFRFAGHTTVDLALSPEASTGPVEVAAGAALTLSIEGSINLVAGSRRFSRAGLTIQAFSMYVLRLFYFASFFAIHMCLLGRDLPLDDSVDTAVLFSTGNVDDREPVTTLYVEVPVSRLSVFSTSAIVTLPATSPANFMVVATVVLFDGTGLSWRIPLRKLLPVKVRTI
jgi:hypothetical protein